MYEVTATASQGGAALGCVSASVQLSAPGAGAFVASSTTLGSAGT
jgi:hypothetical protein